MALDFLGKLSVFEIRSKDSIIDIPEIKIY